MGVLVGDETEETVEVQLRVELDETSRKSILKSIEEARRANTGDGAVWNFFDRLWDEVRG